MVMVPTTGAVHRPAARRGPGRANAAEPHRRRHPADPDQEVRARPLRAAAHRPQLHRDGRQRRAPGASPARRCASRRCCSRTAAGSCRCPRPRQALRGRQERRRHRHAERRLDHRVAGRPRPDHAGTTSCRASAAWSRRGQRSPTPRGGDGIDGSYKAAIAVVGERPTPKAPAIAPTTCASTPRTSPRSRGSRPAACPSSSCSSPAGRWTSPTNCPAGTRSSKHGCPAPRAPAWPTSCSGTPTRPAGCRSPGRDEPRSSRSTPATDRQRSSPSARAKRSQRPSAPTG